MYTHTLSLIHTHRCTHTNAHAHTHFITPSYDLATENRIKKMNSIPKDQMLRPLQRFMLFPQSTFVFSSIWQWEKIYCKGKFKVKSWSCFLFLAWRSNQRTMVCTLRAPGKLHQVQRLHTPNDRFYFSEQLKQIARYYAIYQGVCVCVCVYVRRQIWLYSCTAACPCILPLYTAYEHGCFFFCFFFWAYACSHTLCKFL